MLYLLWFKLLAAAVIILWAGGRLIKFGDIIAEHTKLNRIWLGVTFLGLLTSLPEIANSLSAISTLQLPNLAVSPLFGACLINMLIIAMLDMIYNFYGRGPLLKDIEEETGHVLTAGLAMVLLAIGGLGVLVGKLLPPLSLFGIGMYTLFILVIFLLAQKIIFHFESRDEQKFLDKKVKKLELHDYKKTTLAAAYVKLTFYALCVAAAAAWLPLLGAEVAAVYGLSSTLVGTLLIGLIVTLPELTLAVSAVSIGALDIAVGTLFTSSVFSMAVLFLIDLFGGRGPVLPLVSVVNAVTAFFAILATAVALVGVVYRSEKHFFRRIGWDAFGILLCVAIAIYLLFKLGRF